MTLKEEMACYIDSMRSDLCARADDLFDHPECDGHEVRACGQLIQWLESEGFAAEKGIGGMETAFRAVYQHGTGGPSIGLLTEYDALPGIGHACGHHLQPPAIIGAALALKKCLTDTPYKIVVYGTPAEETRGGKIIMLKNGCFRDIDVALMTHGAPATCVDVKSMACRGFTVTFHGVRAHAAMSPEKGRSALDALLLACQAVEFLREHVREDTRMHYSIVNGGGANNAVPAEASGSFGLRSSSTAYLETVVRRFLDILKGAALMTGTTYDVKASEELDAKIPVLRLNDLFMKNAEAAGAPRIRPPRQKTGSTDFGNVMRIVPGCCIRVAFVPEGSAAHSQEFLDAGKTQAAHDAVIYAAKILAYTAADMIEQPETLAAIRQEFRENLAADAEV